MNSFWLDTALYNGFWISWKVHNNVTITKTHCSTLRRSGWHSAPFFSRELYEIPRGNVTSSECCNCSCRLSSFKDSWREVNAVFLGSPDVDKEWYKGDTAIRKVCQRRLHFFDSYIDLSPFPTIQGCVVRWSVRQSVVFLLMAAAWNSTGKAIFTHCTNWSRCVPSLQDAWSEVGFWLFVKIPTLTKKGIWDTQLSTGLNSVWLSWCILADQRSVWTIHH